MTPQQELWEQWCICRFGKVEVAFTKNERGKLNAAIKQWVEVSATPAILKAKYSAYLRMFPRLPAPTPQALCNQWNALTETPAHTRQTSYVPPPNVPKEVTLEGLRLARQSLPGYFRKTED